MIAPTIGTESASNLMMMKNAHLSCHAAAAVASSCENDEEEESEISKEPDLAISAA